MKPKILHFGTVDVDTMKYIFAADAVDVDAKLYVSISGLSDDDLIKARNLARDYENLCGIVGVELIEDGVPPRSPRF